MDILILYPEIMPYNIPVWRIIRDKGYNIRVIQLAGKKLTPYQYTGEDGIEVHDISEWQDFRSFKEDNYNPQVKLVFVSEVMNPWYWKLARAFHKADKSLPILLGSDAQWTGNLHNYIKKIFFNFTYNKVFTHVLSAGLWQVVYALKIGFKRNQILTPLYCANNQEYYRVDIDAKVCNYPRRFLYVGRLTEQKGIHQLIEAWKSIGDKKGWKLTMIGNGDLEGFIQQQEDIELYPFMQQNEICKIMQHSGCAIVPSLYEPWGLVIHEAAAAGLPIIVSKNCGATNQFVKHGYSGFLVPEGNVDALRDRMKEIMNMSSQDLVIMSKNSRELSTSIIPDYVAAAYLSVLAD